MICGGKKMITDQYRQRFVSLLICAAMVTGSSAWAKAATDSCWQTTEMDAYKLRALQAQLMVITLKCNAMGDTAAADSYNRFVSASQLTLRDAATVLLARFKRLNGRDAMGAMDRFTTDLANQFSAAGMGPNACAQVSGVAEMAARANSTDLLALAHTLVPNQAEWAVCLTEVK